MTDAGAVVETLPYEVDIEGWSRQTYRGVDFFMCRKTQECGKVHTVWKFWVDGKKYGDAWADEPGTFSPNLGHLAIAQIHAVLESKK